VATDDRTDQPASVDSPPGADVLRALGGEMAATCAGFNLRRASRAVSQHFDHALAPSGLRMTQFTLLGALALAGSATTNEMSRALVIDRTTLTRNLRLLRDAGLITSEAGRGGREHHLTLTPDGIAALRRAFPLWRAAQSSILEAFDPARWPALVSDLDRLVDGVIGEHTHPILPDPAAGSDELSRA
jgi:DNA-binding MarR family transcriptional regulator